MTLHMCSVVKVEYRGAAHPKNCAGYSCVRPVSRVRGYCLQDIPLPVHRDPDSHLHVLSFHTLLTSLSRRQDNVHVLFIHCTVRVFV